MAKSIVDQFIEGFGNAVQDIREKVVEQGYFGQVTTDNIQPKVDLSPSEPVGPPIGGSWTEYVKAERNSRDDIQRDDPGLDR